MENSDLPKRIEALKEKLNLEALKKGASEIEVAMAQPDFWQDQAVARTKARELADLKKDIENLERLDLYLEEGDSANLEKLVTELERKTFFSGPYDKGDAILTISAGQGGVEAMDWSEILQRMYMRFAEKKSWEVDVVDFTKGEEAGVKSVTMTIAGSYAYGYLRGEAGVHRLVRQSPFNADHLRQTSFALVEVLPQLEEASEVKINPDDLEWEFFRSSSQGGQNVQKVSTAVRLHHKPTGTIVTCQSQRYQEQNRKIALSMLAAKLWGLRQAQAKLQEKQLKGEHRMASWGNQIRSYVLHPYKMVKDLRTEVESPDPQGVLDGELDLFVDAELRLLVR